MEHRSIIGNRYFFKEVESTTRSVTTSAKTNSDFVNVSLDSFVSQDLSSIDEQLGFIIDLHAMMSQSLHDFASLRALRCSTTDRAALIFSREIHALTHTLRSRN